MEGIAEPRLFPFFSSQCFDRLEVKIEVQVEIIQIFAVDE
jgi:hypothetical protein